MIELRRKYQRKLYLTEQRRLNGMMHQQGAFTDLTPFAVSRDMKSYTR